MSIPRTAPGRSSGPVAAPAPVPVPVSRDPRAGAVVQWVSLVIAAGLAVLAFSTSFEALSDLARTHQAFPPGFESALPLLLDGVAIVAGGVMYVRHVHGEKPGYALVLLLVAMAASVAANMAHAPVAAAAGELAASAGTGDAGVKANAWLSKIISATPPIAFGLVAHLIHDEMGRRVQRRAVREQAAGREQAAIAAAVEQARQARQDAAAQAAAREQAEADAAARVATVEADARGRIEAAERRASTAHDAATRASAGRETVEAQAAGQVEALKVEARRQLEAMQATVQRVRTDAAREVEAARTAAAQEAAKEIGQDREQADGYRRELEAGTARRGRTGTAAGTGRVALARTGTPAGTAEGGTAPGTAPGTGSGGTAGSGTGDSGTAGTTQSGTGTADGVRTGTSAGIAAAGTARERAAEYLAAHPHASAGELAAALDLDPSTGYPRRLRRELLAELAVQPTPTTPDTPALNGAAPAA